MRARQIVLDTETTGLDPAQGHRLIEIGCVELLDRRHTQRRFHTYLQPDRLIDAEAVRVHGITNQQLANEPRFPDIAEPFLDFIRDAELIIHNAPFDLGFLNHELRLCGRGQTAIEQLCAVEDTPVSYTHLDVYKRQGSRRDAGAGGRERFRQVGDGVVDPATAAIPSRPPSGRQHPLARSRACLLYTSRCV